MHGQWTLVYYFTGAWNKTMQFLGSALHVIQISWFICVFANTRRVTKWVQLAGCSLDLVI